MKDFADFLEFGKRRVEVLIRMMMLRDDVSVRDVVAAAYLQGVKDGWEVCEKIKKVNKK